MVEIAQAAAAHPTTTLMLAAAFDLACWAGMAGLVAVRSRWPARARSRRASLRSADQG